MCRAERRQHLHEQYFFECRCSACEQDVDYDLYFQVRTVRFVSTAVLATDPWELIITFTDHVTGVSEKNSE